VDRTLVTVGLVMLGLPLAAMAALFVYGWAMAIRDVIQGGPTVDREAAGSVVLIGWLAIAVVLIVAGSVTAR
jgi:type VI protein secretion system component VasK